MRIDSLAGQGCGFVIRVPLTLALHHALLVEAGEPFALPLANVNAVVRLSLRELLELEAREEPVYEYEGEQYTLAYLGAALEIGAPPRSEEREPHPVVLVKSGASGAALWVDSLIGRQEIAVKALVPPLIGVRCIAGATVLGDGRVALILDIPSVVRRALTMHTGANKAGASVPQPETVRDPESPPIVMVVDDSITVRQVTKRLLIRHGVEV